MCRSQRQRLGSIAGGRPRRVAAEEQVHRREGGRAAGDDSAATGLSDCGGSFLSRGSCCSAWPQSFSWSPARTSAISSWRAPRRGVASSRFGSRSAPDAARLIRQVLVEGLMLAGVRGSRWRRPRDLDDLRARRLRLHGSGHDCARPLAGPSRARFYGRGLDAARRAVCDRPRAARVARRD